MKSPHKVVEGGAIPTDARSIDCLAKWVERLYGHEPNSMAVRNPQSWDLFVRDWNIVWREFEGVVMIWVASSSSKCFLCRASELWASPRGLRHPDYSLTRGDVMFCHGRMLVLVQKLELPERIEVMPRAS